MLVPPLVSKTTLNPPYPEDRAEVTLNIKARSHEE